MNQMLKNVDRNKVLLVLNWCISRFGKSKYCKTYPRLFVYKSAGTSLDKEHDGRCGHYCDGSISIFLGSNKDLKDLCGTVIHEYKHYLLNDKEFQREYRKLKKQGLTEEVTNQKHTHEKKARRFENKWKFICYNDLKKQLTRF